MKKLTRIFLAIILILVISKLIPIKKNEGDLNLKPFIEETKPSEEVLTILKNSCYDCHSNYTKYPDYYKLPLLNLWIARHISEGKKHLNFSEWKNYNEYQKEHIFEEIAGEVRGRKMPMKSYLLKHPEAKIGTKEMVAVIEWVKQNEKTKN